MIYVAIIAAIAGGILNGSCNLFMRMDAPMIVFRLCQKGAIAAEEEEEEEKVKIDTRGLVFVFDFKTLTPSGWQFENAWLLFTLWSVVLSFAYCYAVIPVNTLHTIFRSAPTRSLALLVTFSFLWGIGTIGYGQIIAMMGMSLGTSLIMAVVISIGTALPLIVFGAEVNMQLLFIIFGILLAVVGFSFSAYAGLKRDAAIEIKIQPDLELGTASSSKVGNIEEEVRRGEKVVAVGDVDDEDGSIAMNQKGEEGDNKVADTHIAAAQELPFLYKISIAFIGGLFASQLQFGFVFGNDIIKEAGKSKYNVSDSYTSLCIWYWAFLIAAIPNVIYCCIMLNRNGTWSRFWRTPGFLSKCTKTLIMSAMWSGHIHLYGFSTEQFGEDLGAALAWPILMSSTVFAGQLCAIMLEEWKEAPAEAKRMNWLSMAALISSVASLAVAGLVYS